MKKPILVVMAAGMGSRYGGLKQIDPVGKNGEIIMDFSVFDAVQAGFSKVVFIIKEQLFEDFKEVIGDRVSKYVQVEYVFQKLDDLPEGFTVPEGREKPWGTATPFWRHATTLMRRLSSSTRTISMAARRLRRSARSSGT